jgi:tetratricopeptide (TPR) repeat protein
MRAHESEQWLEIQQHLPNPATASPETLEEQADILRARRFPEDAMDFYKYAQTRGGNAASLLNKMGLTELEMRNIELARAYFQRVVKLTRKDPEAWNNLGAVEFLDGASQDAVSDYKKAIKLNKREAVFHANLATAYFDRKEGTGGVAAHVLSSQDRARFSFEMAKLYAQNGLEEQMLHSLAMACEAGMSVQREMHGDAVLAKYELDPRVIVLVHNAEELRAGRAATASASGPANPGTATPAAKPVSE